VQYLRVLCLQYVDNKINFDIILNYIHSSLISIAILVYFFLFLRFLITLSNFITKPYLPFSNQPYTDLVSILVPARNEALNIPHLLESIRQQDYSHYELIILDDESSDETARVVLDFAASEPRCRLIASKPLRAGWLGKNWACYQLAAYASGRYLLFIDADVQVFTGFISSALHEIKRKKLSLLSVFNDQSMITAGEKMIVPLMHYILLTLLPLHLVYRVKNYFVAAASGQCMFFEKEAYQQHQFHKQAKSKVVEDIFIMQLVKRNALKGASCLGNGLIRCRMYRSYIEGIAGFSKNLMAGFGNSAWATSLFVMAVTIGYFSFFSSAFLSVFTNSTYLYLFYSSVLFLILGIRIMVSALSNQNIFVNLLFHPVQMATILLLLAVSVYKRVTHSNRWKGRLIFTK